MRRTIPKGATRQRKQFTGMDVIVFLQEISRKERIFRNMWRGSCSWRGSKSSFGSLDTDLSDLYDLDTKQPGKFYCFWEPLILLDEIYWWIKKITIVVLWDLMILYTFTLFTRLARQFWSTICDFINVLFWTINQPKTQWSCTYRTLMVGQTCPPPIKINATIYKP